MFSVLRRFGSLALIPPLALFPLPLALSPPPLLVPPAHPLGTIPRDMNVVFAAGHQHIGGINTTLSFGKDSGSLKPLCTSVPKYGSTQGKAGDEKGYVTALSTCTPANSPSNPAGKKGDVVRVDSLYNVDPADPRSFDKGAHYGVMSLFYIAVTKTKGGRAEEDGGDEALVAAFDQVAHA